MERLTEHTADGYIAIKGCASVYPTQERKRAPMTSAISRLAAYEDSGLTPEEVAEMANIVRCRECKSCEYDSQYGTFWCVRTTGTTRVFADDFCSYGEKKGE